MFYFLIMAGIVVLDQVVKKIITLNLALNESIAVITDIFHITYIRNTGAAFSLFEGLRILLILLPAILIFAAMVYLFIKRKTAHPLLLLALSFICGGGMGNLIDRAGCGYVVDYLDFQVFPVFNVADIFVCLGCGLLILYIIFIDGKASEKEGHDKGNYLQSDHK